MPAKDPTKSFRRDDAMTPRSLSGWIPLSFDLDKADHDLPFVKGAYAPAAGQWIKAGFYLRPGLGRKKKKKADLEVLSIQYSSKVEVRDLHLSNGYTSSL